VCLQIAEDPEPVAEAVLYGGGEYLRGFRLSSGMRPGPWGQLEVAKEQGKCKAWRRVKCEGAERLLCAFAGVDALGLDSGGFGVLGVELGDLDFFGEADLGEEPDAVVVGVELVPDEAVTGTDRVGVVVVVPAFATGEQSDPPTVAGVVLGLEAAVTPDVGGGVDQPGGVEADGDAKEGSPENHAECSDDAVAGRGDGCTESDLEQTGDDEREVVIFAEPDVDTITGKVRGVATEQRGLGVESAAGENPASVCPPGAVVRGVGVAVVVGVLMMDAVGGYPEDGSALECEASAGRDEVFDPLGGLVTAVREQAVIAHADADVNGEDVHDDEGGDVGPGEEEEGRNGADVEESHGNGGDPVDLALLELTAHAEVLLDPGGDLGNGRALWHRGEDGCCFFGRAVFECAKGRAHLFRYPFTA